MVKNCLVQRFGEMGKDILSILDGKTHGEYTLLDGRTLFMGLVLTSVKMVLAWMGSVLFWAMGGVSFVWGGLVLLVTSLVISPRHLPLLTRGVCWVALLFSGHPTVFKNPSPNPRKGPYIYVFNHASMLDGFIVMTAIPEYTVGIGKIEQFSIPFWKWIVARWGVVGIDRSNSAHAIARLGDVVERVKKGDSVLISPEGTRSASGQLGPFKKGAFHLALEGKAPICPIRIRGAYEGKRPGSWLMSPTVVQIEYLPLVIPDEGGSVDELLEQTRSRFLESGLS